MKPEPPVPAPGRGEARAAEPEGRWREKGEADTERQRTRERQEATLAGLAELDHLRQRQELLVRGALRCAGVPGVPAPRAGELPGDAAQRSRLEEKFLEENILLLRKQLNCLRRRDAGLLNQLQELDKQISDLRLDVDKTSEELLETDSRPSSGFYELSDGASGSLSNSSNSVFSECLSSCHSSTCFCSPLEATLSISDGCLKSADVNPKYQCDLVSRNGNDVYRYPSPLHAVAVQSPMFLLGLREEERLGSHAGDGCVGAGLDTGPADSSFPAPGAPGPAARPSSRKRMDGYILSLVQKKTHPVRTHQPRTSVTAADPTKGLLRNGSVCARAAGVPPAGGQRPQDPQGPQHPPRPAKAAPAESPKESSPGQPPRKPRPAPVQVPAAAAEEEAPAGRPPFAPGPGPQPGVRPQQGVRPHRAHRGVAGTPRSSTLKPRGQGPERGPPAVRERSRAPSRRCRFPDDLDAHKKLKKTSAKARRGGGGGGGMSEAGLPGGHRAGVKGHGHGREAVVAKPKHKRTDYRRWKSSAEVSYEEALRRVRRARREHVGAFPGPVALPYGGPYAAFAASDSEYSAECESLFHSTVLDTSEDERSNYTTNCFGDSESSVSDGDLAADSSTSSDSEESAGLLWSQLVQTLPIPAPPDLRGHPKAFVKIKASHQLKKKILRFRSGSLKLMTTV